MLLLLELRVFDKDLAVFAPVFGLDAVSLGCVSSMYYLLSISSTLTSCLWMSKMTQFRLRERLNPGELARTSTRLNVEKARLGRAFPRPLELKLPLSTGCSAFHAFTLLSLVS